MKVILLSRVEGLGDAGDFVEVDDLRAQKELFPKGLAAAATGDKARQRTEVVPTPIQTPEEDLERVQQLAEVLDNTSITLRRSDTDAPVSAEDILRELFVAVGTLPAGIRPKLSQPLEGFGERKVTLELPHGLEAVITVLMETAPRAEEE